MENASPTAENVVSVAARRLPVAADNKKLVPDSPGYIDDPSQSSTVSEDHASLIKYTIQYVGQVSGTWNIDQKAEEVDVSKEPLVFEYVDVRQSGLADLSAHKEDITKTERGKRQAYIKILSPAVAEALRCVVDYFPAIDFSSDFIRIYEPFEVFVFYEKELSAYRERLLAADLKGDRSTCPNRWAVKHLRIVQDFVRERTGEAVEAERERHARGYVTFDMLWLLYRPGQDVYLDEDILGEHEPAVLFSTAFNIQNGSTNSYRFSYWRISSDPEWIGPSIHTISINRFAGQQKILDLEVYPCEYLRLAEGLNEHDVTAIRQYFINRGKKWYSLRRKVRPWQFDGHTYRFPRKSLSSLVIVDPIAFAAMEEKNEIREAAVLAGAAHPSSPKRICSCEACGEHIYQHAVAPKFSNYSKVNPLTVESLTDHHYFLCDARVMAFLFKSREWANLRIEGFREPTFDGSLFERLVMKDATKQFIKNVTQMYVLDSAQAQEREDKLYTRVTDVHKPAPAKPQDVSWSIDLIEGKGEGLTLLLHGRPGVGKTYTAECISDFTGRPLLSLTCSDIGVKPDDIERNLRKWFSMARTWGAIMLIDEADIYMEQRQVQDIERNHLVAGFLRALEYYKGILFLTTNRVGTFDEAFMSRIHVQIHYPDFDDSDRDRLWSTFFDKLEDDREATMRIMQPTKDYIHESQELRDLKWNGREIRNAFQVAVALAEAQSHKDQQGRVLIKPDHIKATVQMSREFQDYLNKVHRGDFSKKASLEGIRHDAYGKRPERPAKY